MSIHSPQFVGATVMQLEGSLTRFRLLAVERSESNTLGFKSCIGTKGVLHIASCQETRHFRANSVYGALLGLSRPLKRVYCMAWFLPVLCKDLGTATGGVSSSAERGCASAHIGRVVETCVYPGPRREKCILRQSHSRTQLPETPPGWTDSDPHGERAGEHTHCLKVGDDPVAGRCFPK